MLYPIWCRSPVNPHRQLEGIGDHPRLETIGSIRHLQAVMKPILPAATGGSLVKLVHLYNPFCKVDGAKPLQVGDVCKRQKLASFPPST
ncbi:uncharacterized protein LACBIDRAFT_314211 [Laccaria bicolor S238N-H82]|uniref:Uncharacterized protein FAS-5 n=1 Tax=Laccaria bicolor (strain S238N-H82 / ATCC MYA-4686) TaxID=486041 RepID=B0D1U3_LACBS|nr:uncharacterized protein LACBIDRAFT_314211 [Laccaria bicolor S238N-H82]EDR11705.1 hypothetical protein LACBIDRAFT_314211 [Laccaria bicolor S238N-H82]|eukprot:XP_001877602.1 hypothetical protein LACBIDRAFT_314211 [Laccaria bicolor S238N-H82]